jgi:hypothetical protein
MARLRQAKSTFRARTSTTSSPRLHIVAAELRLARLAIPAHNDSMGNSKPKTKFEPVQMKAEPGWHVRITLPHGEQIHINEFITESEARSWIDDKSATWLKKYRGGRYA